MTPEQFTAPPPPPSDRDPDTELAFRARDGDREAFDRLFNHYYPAIMRYCLFRLGDRELAEDVTQDVFLNAFRFIHTLRTSFPAFIFTIARHAVYHEWRRRAEERERHVHISDEGGLWDSIPDPHQLDERDPLREEQLLQAVAGLPETYRSVFELRDLAELSYAEIGEVLGITAGAARVRHLRARAFLQRDLAHLADGERS